MVKFMSIINYIKENYFSFHGTVSRKSFIKMILFFLVVECVSSLGIIVILSINGLLSYIQMFNSAVHFIPMAINYLSNFLFDGSFSNLFNIPFLDMIDDSVSRLLNYYTVRSTSWGIRILSWAMMLVMAGVVIPISIVSQISFVVRRLHDMNINHYFALLYIIPFPPFLMILTLILAIFPSRIEQKKVYTD